MVDKGKWKKSDFRTKLQWRPLPAGLHRKVAQGEFTPHAGIHDFDNGKVQEFRFSTVSTGECFSDFSDRVGTISICDQWKSQKSEVS